jgi:hypothetical protein
MASTYFGSPSEDPRGVIMAELLVSYLKSLRSLTLFMRWLSYLSLVGFYVFEHPLLPPSLPPYCHHHGKKEDPFRVNSVQLRWYYVISF